MRLSTPRTSCRRSLPGWLLATAFGLALSSGCEPASEPPRRRAERIHYDLIRKTEFDPDKLGVPPEYPAEVEALDGRQIEIAGFMSPFDDLDDMRRFMLRPTPVGCYFCAVPSPVEVLLVRHEVLDPGEEYPFVPAAIEVTGRLKLWLDGQRDPDHREFPFIVEKARVREIPAGRLPEELREKHENATRKGATLDADGEEEDF